MKNKKPFVATVKLVIEAADVGEAIEIVQQHLNPHRGLFDWGFAPNGHCAGIMSRAFPAEVKLPPDYLWLREEIARLETDASATAQEQANTLQQQAEELFDSLGNSGQLNQN